MKQLEGVTAHGYTLRFIHHILRIRYTRNKKQPALSEPLYHDGVAQKELVAFYVGPGIQSDELNNNKQHITVDNSYALLYTVNNGGTCYEHNH